MPSLDIVPFNIENLSQGLYYQQYSLSPTNVANDSHIIYLKDYLGDDGLRARYILTEEEYISHDYLDGFAAYYALSFQMPERNCKRLHFFASTHDNELFRQTLTQALIEPGAKNDNFWHESYLGFIVVKPLAVCNIGHTVLKHYNDNPKWPSYKKTRLIWATKEYTCHLFGREIKINSLAFQEQDTNLAACASIAIWTMLQMAAKDHFIPLKSPGQITRDAGLTSYNGNRLFPNEGLLVEQICTAITANGLMTEVRTFDSDAEDEFDMNRLRRFVNAYSGLQIPLILAIAVPDNGEYCGHAVAIAGHEYPTDIPSPPLPTDGERPVVHRADAMVKLYVHDDAWGCFARMDFVNNKGFYSAWNLSSANENLLCLPLSLIIPVYSKVRIPYEDIQAFVYFPDSLIKRFFDKVKKYTAISWDVKAMYSEAVKQHVAHLPYWSGDVFTNLKMAIVKTSMPKYVWMATCYWDGIETINFLFDATEMKNGQLGLHLIFHGHEEQLFVNEQINQITDEDLADWNFQGDPYIDYCLYFMRKEIMQFDVPPTND